MLDASKYDFTVAGYLEWLSSLAGLSAADNASDYFELVAHCGPESARAFLCGPTPPGAPNSGCMIVQCGAVEHFFSAHAKPTPLTVPLGFDRWNTLTQWAGIAGAIVAPGQWSPEPADIVLVFKGPNHQHWIGLNEKIDDGDETWSTIEGGQLDGAFQCVQALKRTLTKPAGKWVAAQKDVVQVIRVRTLVEAAS